MTTSSNLNQSEGSVHNFIESSDEFGEYARLIYCTWCGRVIWHFNKNEQSDTKPSELQSHVGESCIKQKGNDNDQ